MAKPRLLRAIIVLPVIVLLSMTFASCTGGGTISLSVVPKTYKFTSAGSKGFEIDVTGIGEVVIDNVELIPETKFKFPAGVPNCIGEKVGTNLPACVETVSLPTFQGGLSAVLKVTVKNLKEEAQLSS
jgi:hypothetical protein